MYFVYLLQCKDDSLYCGYTKELSQRELVHNAGKGSKYVRAHGGGKIVYSEKFKSLSAALKREAAIKKLPRPKKLELIKKKK